MHDSGRADDILARMATTPCPRCQTQLSERTSGRAKLLACGDCGGVWLDPPSAKKVVSHMNGALSQIALSQRIAKSARLVVDEAPAIRCPFDAEPLRRVAVDGVDVDVCTVHGTWFDADEVRRIANAHLAEVEAKRPPPSGVASSQSEDGVAVFLDAVFEAASEI
jgi:Zn-finger nucleic acid-binding protein